MNTKQKYINARRKELTILLAKFTKPSHQRVIKERIAALDKLAK